METRRFKIFLNKTHFSPRFSLNGLPSFGRLDSVCRMIISAFFLDGDIRRDTICEFYSIPDQKVLRIEGKTMRGIHPDERSIAGILRKVFKHEEVEGFSLEDCSLTDMCEKKGLLLDKKGQHVFKSLPLPYTPIYLGDPYGIPTDILSMLKKNCIPISLGKNSYLSSQCISIIHFLYDNDQIRL